MINKYIGWIWLSRFLRQNVESVRWLLLVAYGKVQQERDEVKKELADLEAE